MNERVTRHDVGAETVEYADPDLRARRALRRRGRLSEVPAQADNRAVPLSPSSSQASTDLPHVASLCREYLTEWPTLTRSNPATPVARDLAQAVVAVAGGAHLAVP